MQQPALSSGISTWGTVLQLCFIANGEIGARMCLCFEWVYCTIQRIKSIYTTYWRYCRSCFCRFSKMWNKSLLHRETRSCAQLNCFIICTFLWCLNFNVLLIYGYLVKTLKLKSKKSEFIVQRRFYITTPTQSW